MNSAPQLPFLVLVRIALMGTLSTTMNLTYVMRSKCLANHILDRHILYQQDADLESLDPRALLWFTQQSSFSSDSVRWEEMAIYSMKWPLQAQRALINSDKIDWAFEDVIELGYLNGQWNHDEIVLDKIESWLWHYGESLDCCPDYERRRQFATSAIDAGAGSKWIVSDEDKRKEEERLQHLIDMFFGGSSS